MANITKTKFREEFDLPETLEDEEEDLEENKELVRAPQDKSLDRAFESPLDNIVESEVSYDIIDLENIHDVNQVSERAERYLDIIDELLDDNSEVDPKLLMAAATQMKLILDGTKLKAGIKKYKEGAVNREKRDKNAKPVQHQHIILTREDAMEMLAERYKDVNLKDVKVKE